MPVHDRTLYVRLSCGHERVSRGWRGQQGERICCDVCHVMTTIEKVEATLVEPFGWQLAPPIMPPRAFATVSPVGMFDAARNAEMAIRQYNAAAAIRQQTAWMQTHARLTDLVKRYGQVRPWWEAYGTVAYRDYVPQAWPLSPPAGSPHGDPMASSLGWR